MVACVLTLYKYRHWTTHPDDEMPWTPIIILFIVELAIGVRLVADEARYVQYMNGIPSDMTSILQSWHLYTPTCVEPSVSCTVAFDSTDAWNNFRTTSEYILTGQIHTLYKRVSTSLYWGFVQWVVFAPLWIWAVWTPKPSDMGTKLSQSWVRIKSLLIHERKHIVI